MAIIEKTIRIAAIVLAVLFIGLSLFGILGVWFVDRKATDVALKGFGLIEVGIGVVDAGVGRVNDLIPRAGRKCGRPPKPSPPPAHRRRRTAPCSAR